MAPNSIEPKIKQEATPDIKPKKHVKIKEEPIRFGKSPTFNEQSSSRPIIPITPNEKILKHPPNLKSIDNININRFIIPTKDEPAQDETPTRSAPRPKRHGEHLNKGKELEDESSQHNHKKRHKQYLNNQPATAKSTASEKLLSPAISERCKATTKPPKFQAFEESIILNDAKDELDIGKVFQNIDDVVNKGKYIEIGNKSFDDWCATGIKLTNIQYGIVKKVILSRNKLNLKFGMILKLINKHGESLEKEDVVLKEKMKRLQNLGEEIRNFIK